MKTRGKRPYSKPVLRSYGSVRNLTGGSSGPGNDGLGGFTGMGTSSGSGVGMGMGRFM